MLSLTVTEELVKLFGKFWGSSLFWTTFKWTTAKYYVLLKNVYVLNAFISKSTYKSI